MDNNIEQLNIEINAKVKSSNKKVDNLTLSLQKLQNVSYKGFDRLEQSIAKLNALGVGNLKNIGSNINKLANSLAKLKSVKLTGFSNKMQALVRGLAPLQTFNATNIASVGSGVSKLSNGLNKLKLIDVKSLSTQIKSLAIALTPLTNEMLRGSTAAQAYASVLNNLRRSTTALNAKAGKKQMGIFGSIASLAILKRALIGILNVTKDVITETASWTENLNLFSVTFGQGEYEEVLDWALDLSEAFGLASNEIVRFTGLFKQLATSLGVVSETGTAMSKVLTQIGYDISSFYNISVESAMEKLQAGIYSGQTKPLRAVGIDVTYQSIDNLLAMDSALAKFNMTSKSLVQSQKAIARTIITLQSAHNAMGDTADTINSLENTIKILQGSITNLKLAVGDLIADFAKKVIILAAGIINGITKVIRMIKPLTTATTQDLGDASVFSELTEDVEDLEEAMGLLDFDYFNTLTTGTDKENLSITQALTEALEQQIALYDEIFNTSLENINNAVTDIGDNIAKWVFPNGFVSDVTDFKNILKQINPLLIPISISVGAIVTALLLAYAPVVVLVGAVTWLVVELVKLSNAIKDLYNSWDILSTRAKIVIAVIAPFPVLLGVIIKHFDEISQFVLRLGENIKILFQNIWIAFTKFISLSVDYLTSKLNGFIYLLNSIIAPITKIGNYLGKDWKIPTITYKMQTEDYVQFKADGGTFDTKGGYALGVVDEGGANELVYSNSANQVQVSNEQGIENAFISALSKIFVPMMNETIRTIQRQDGNIIIDGTKLGKKVAKAVYAENVRTGRI